MNSNWQWEHHYALNCAYAADTDEQESLRQLYSSLGLQGSKQKKNPRLSGIDALPPERRE